MYELRKRLRRTNLGRRAARLFCRSTGDVLPARDAFGSFAVRNTGNRKGRDKRGNSVNAKLGGFFNHEVHFAPFEHALSQCEVKGACLGRSVLRNADLSIRWRDMQNLSVVGRTAFIVQDDAYAAVEPQDVPQMVKLCSAELGSVLRDGLG